MVVILVNFLTVTPAKYIHPSTAAAAVAAAVASVTARKRKLPSQYLTEAGKKTRMALPKWADKDFELGWKEQIQMVQ
jgi:hypothetical protein